MLMRMRIKAKLAGLLLLLLLLAVSVSAALPYKPSGLDEAHNGILEPKKEQQQGEPATKKEKSTEYPAKHPPMADLPYAEPVKPKMPLLTSNLSDLMGHQEIVLAPPTPMRKIVDSITGSLQVVSVRRSYIEMGYVWIEGRLAVNVTLTAAVKKKTKFFVTVEMHGQVLTSETIKVRPKNGGRAVWTGFELSRFKLYKDSVLHVRVFHDSVSVMNPLVMHRAIKVKLSEDRTKVSLQHDWKRLLRGTSSRISMALTVETQYHRVRDTFPPMPTMRSDEYQQVVRRFEANATQAVQRFKREHPDYDDYTYLLVGGLFTGAYPGYFSKIKKLLSEQLGASRVVESDIHTTQSVAVNVKTLVKEIKELHAKHGKKLVVYGHSKGCVDLVAAIAENTAELKDKIHTALYVQGPIMGSPAPQFFDRLKLGRLLKPLLNFVLNGLGSAQAVYDLDVPRRVDHLLKHPYPVGDIPTVTLGSHLTFNYDKLNDAHKVMLLPIGMLYQRVFGTLSDSLVSQTGAILPGSIGIMVDDMDHMSGGMSMPGNPHPCEEVFFGVLSVGFNKANRKIRPGMTTMTGFAEKQWHSLQRDRCYEQDGKTYRSAPGACELIKSKATGFPIRTCNDDRACRSLKAPMHCHGTCTCGRHLLNECLCVKQVGIHDSNFVCTRHSPLFLQETEHMIEKVVRDYEAERQQQH